MIMFIKKRPRILGTRFPLLFLCPWMLCWALSVKSAVPSSFFVGSPTIISPTSLAPTTLQENALFFSSLVGISLTTSFSEPLFGLKVENINLNLVTRERRDPQGKQLVVVRVAGTVRSNHNVELDLLNSSGDRVGRFFLGYRTGDLIVFNEKDEQIIRGQLNSDGTFQLDDLRSEGINRRIASGIFQWCALCPGFEYEWYDGADGLIASGFMYFWPESSFFQGINGIRTHWQNEKGDLSSEERTQLEAEFDLRKEVTGAINSNVFDKRQDAQSFLLAPPKMTASGPFSLWLPDIDEKALLTIYNGHPNQNAQMKLTAYLYNGDLIQKEGVRNPIYLQMTPQSSWSAPLRSWLRGLFNGDPAMTERVLAADGRPCWVEIQSNDDHVSALLKEEAERGSIYRAGFSTEDLARQFFLPLPEVSWRKSAEITILNTSLEAGSIHLTVRDQEGMQLGQVKELWVPAHGFRTQALETANPLFSDTDLTKAAILEVNTLSASSAMIAMFSGKQAPNSYFTLSGDPSGDMESSVWAPYFVSGRDSNSQWGSRLICMEKSGRSATFLVEVFTLEGDLLKAQEYSLLPKACLEMEMSRLLDLQEEGWVNGFLRITGLNGGQPIGGVFTSSQALGGSATTWAGLHPLPSRFFQTLIPIPMTTGSDGQYIGVAFLNPGFKEIPVEIEITMTDNRQLHRQLTLLPNRSHIKLLEELFPADEAIHGPFRLSINAAEPIFAQVLWSQGPSLLCWLPLTFRLTP